MTGDDFCIYTKGSQADYAYIIRSGSVYVDIDGKESFAMDGANLIFGTSEMLLSQEDNYSHYRIFTLNASPDVKFAKVDSKTILDIISRYNIGFAVAKTIASILLEINQIIAKKKEEIGEREKRSEEYCKIFARSIDTLAFQYEKKRFPWLEHIIAKSKSSLIYSKGHAFLSISQTPRIEMKGIQVEDFSKVFAPGSTICKQGEFGNELYILANGRLSVSINGKELTVIKERGSIIGEMALLLGERRSATIKASERTTLTVVKKSNIKSFAESHSSFLLNLILDLSRRMERNYSILLELFDIISNEAKKNNGIPSAIGEDRYKDELQDLRDVIKDLYEKKDMDWIEVILKDINNSMHSLRK